MPGDDVARDRLAEVLLSRGYLTEGQLAEANELQRTRGMPLGQLLVEMGLLTRLQLAGLLTEQWSAPAGAARAAPRPPAPGPPALPPAPAPPAPAAPTPAAPAPAPVGPPAAGPAAAPVVPFDVRERLDELDARLGRLEASVDRLASRVDEPTDAAPREAVEDLRMALRELWKVQKSLLEHEPSTPGRSRSA